MTKIRFMRIALAVLSTLILIGVALMIYVLVAFNNRNIIKINIENGETQAVEFKKLDLIPGEECNYTLSLSSKVADEYDILLVFRETEEHTLKDYARVRMESNGEVICDKLLAEMFTGNGISLSFRLVKDRSEDIQITYYLPEDVGNEAQNAEAAFELLITASNE